jgi:hypothetical protein
MIELDKTMHGRTHSNIKTKNTLKFFARYFSSEPHQAGSRRSEELADEIKRRWNDYGFHVETPEYNVLLPRAKEDNPDYFEIKDQNGNVTMRHKFVTVVSP